MFIKVEDVSKTIKGREVLSSVNLSMHAGVIYGFEGRNGSGKTMLFRIVSGLVRPTTGLVFVNGKILQKDLQTIPELGIMIENIGLYPGLSGYENLSMLANYRKSISEEEIKSAISRVGLSPDEKKPFQKYSLGMKRRLVFAQAIMEKPKVLMLDEPTNGLDDEGIECVRRIILEEKERGALIMIASHNKDDIRLLADKSFFVSEGCVKEVKG